MSTSNKENSMATSKTKKTKVAKKKTKKAVSKKKQVARAAVAALYSNPMDYAEITAAQKKAQAERKKREAEIAKLQEGLRKLSFEELVNSSLRDAEDFYYVLFELNNRSRKPLKMTLGSRSYPVSISDFYVRDGVFSKYCTFQVAANFFDVAWRKHRSVYSTDFVDALGHPSVRSMNEVLKDLGMSISSQEDLEENKQLLSKTMSYRNASGQAIEVVGSVFQKNDFWWGPPVYEVPFGTKKHPRLSIIEAELELNAGDDDYYGDESVADIEFPFLRIFSLDLKKYVYVDVRDIQAHEYQTGAIDKLVLPHDLKNVITSVFDAKDVFGDLFSGRHGGMIILANGTPGIGKTLTAEVFAEKTKRPLYVLEMGELGVSLDKVEQSLQTIFTRAARWNTVLLFDEVDIFLSKRTEHDLERNAIVGVFLRLLDQYKGLLFLTTNRAEIIDPAFASRITLRLDYPELSNDSRYQIWNHMLNAAQLQVDGDHHAILSRISMNKLNGRQIRNVVRLLKATATSDVVSLETIENYIKFSPANK